LGKKRRERRKEEGKDKAGATQDQDGSKKIN